MTEMTPKRPNQEALDIAVLKNLFRDPHTALFAGALGALALMMVLDASGALDGFMFRSKYNRYGQDLTLLRIGIIVSPGLFGFEIGWFIDVPDVLFIFTP